VVSTGGGGGVAALSVPMYCAGTGEQGLTGVCPGSTQPQATNNGNAHPHAHHAGHPSPANREKDVLAYVNDTEYGLAAYVFDSDLERALKMAERLEVGMVGVNRGTVSDPSVPFGGVKQSGLGREGAQVGIREFQETQYLSVAWSS
jgi:hypothetical protein